MHRRQDAAVRRTKDGAAPCYNRTMKRALPTVLVAVVGVGLGLYASRDVWRRYHDERRDADQARTEMRAAELRKADLQRQKADLESEAGRERLARERGWIKPGETRL